MAEKQTNKDRMREIVDSIENGIKELFESDKYRKYLATMSRFHRYSVNNTMLIYMQRPDATHVAGFNKWRDQFGGNVLKGEKGIRIIAPTPYKKKVEEIKTDPKTNAPVLDADGKAIIEEKEIRIPMFKVVSVFDVSQTAGKPLPQLAADLSGNVQQYEVFMEALRRASPVPMEIKPVARDTDGFFSIKAQSITIRAGMSEVQTVCAAVHEIAHAKLHDYEHMTELADDGETILVPGEKSRNTEEVEAESISYAVCQYYGIETGENSFGYIATWSKGKELKELRASLETINKTASELITDIDRHFAEICKERGINREEVSATQTDEALYLVDGSVYLHVQHTDGRNLCWSSSKANRPKNVHTKQRPKRARKRSFDMNITFEELQLMSIYNTGTRTGLIAALEEMRGYLAADETELRELTDSTIAKLCRMNDAEYDALDLFPDFTT